MVKINKLIASYIQYAPALWSFMLIESWEVIVSGDKTSAKQKTAKVNTVYWIYFNFRYTKWENEQRERAGQRTVDSC